MTSAEAPRVRCATIEDLARLEELRTQFTFEDALEPPIVRDDYSEAFASIVGSGIETVRWTVWIAEVDGEIVSHIYVGLLKKIPRPIPGHRSIGYVTNVYTQPPQRGRGLGSVLLDHVQGWARANDVELLLVWPSEESIEFYERVGFASGRDPLVWEQTRAAES